MKFLSRKALAAAFVVATTVGVAQWAAAQDLEPAYQLRGERATAASFSFTRLQSSADRTVVDAARRGAFEACMAERGFEGEPHNAEGAVAYTEAAIGDDGTSDVPPAEQAIALPGGGEMSVSVTWKPDSCTYVADQSLGADPIRREAMRLRMMILQEEYLQAAAAQLEKDPDPWSACAVDAYDLVVAVDSSRERAASDSCLTPVVERLVATTVGREAIRVAAENAELVDAWVELVDREAKAARDRH